MSFYFTLVLFLTILPELAVSLVGRQIDAGLDRRGFLVGASSVVVGTTAWVAKPQDTLAADRVGIRLEQDILNLPPPSSASEFNGVDNTYFPPFLQGTWDVTQTLIRVNTPLGLKFVGGPNADLAIAEKTMTETRSQIGVPVQLQLRYVPTKWGVTEDRIFNTQARLNGFAGKTVVASVSYADVGGSNRKSVLALGGTENDPLQTTITYFKGPAAQKSFLIAHGAENLGDSSWAGYEVQRSIFALTNQNTAPPITTDTEYIWKFDKVDSRSVTGQLRIASYLNAQNDKLYFEARNRAVSLLDYTLVMKRKD